MRLVVAGSVQGSGARLSRLRLLEANLGAGPN